ncbi:MAG: radical SAM family heme chaperone HemW [Elusimicrobia bacterium]|nr:radical SAM family heme chaperone HemW [Elusimicrobiota bacterium]
MTGLYVHIPFCSVKCFYCDFAAFSGQSRQAGRYLAALEAEASLRPFCAPETLYVGGGTPSELTAPQIVELFERLGRAYPAAKLNEITFEGNPESLTDDKLTALRSAGVTRLSIGLQTADDALLPAIGRRHTAADFTRVFGAARRAGIPSLNVDLMYGLPGQTLESLRRTLDFVLDLRPEHVSLYGLQVEDRTLFARRGVEENNDNGRDMYEAAIRALAEAGLEHYEISNFARPGHRSRHNDNYWLRGNYVGLGCSAASFAGGRRSANEERLIPYLEAVEAGRLPDAESEAPKGLEALGEEAFLGLRRIEGFAPSSALRAAFAGPWATLKARGLAREDGPRWRLTGEGVFLANEAFREFVPPFALQETVE